MDEIRDGRELLTVVTRAKAADIYSRPPEEIKAWLAALGYVWTGEFWDKNTELKPALKEIQPETNPNVEWINALKRAIDENRTELERVVAARKFIVGLEKILGEKLTPRDKLAQWVVYDLIATRAKHLLAEREELLKEAQQASNSKDGKEILRQMNAHQN
jgi:hypothetical protein